MNGGTDLIKSAYGAATSSTGIQRKRKRADFEAEGFRFPPKLHVVGTDDEEDDEVTHVKKESDIGTTRYAFSGGVLDQDHNSLYEVSDTESQLNRAKTKKLRVLSSMSRFTPPATPQKQRVRIRYVIFPQEFAIS